MPTFDAHKVLHPRAFKVTVGWTLLLLLLGSIVHATESSLACPDWPTCFGTLAPEMTGGVFWEHLHRLVASGLGLMWGLATWLAWREAGDRPRIFRWCLAGMALIVVQGVFGGITVLYQLPDLVSTTHWGLALLFLTLATALSAVTHTPGPGSMPEPTRSRLGSLGTAAAGLVFAQSLLGAYVRHTDAGMSCPDVPLCLGRVVPPLVNHLIIAHFFHRVLALVATLLVIGLAVWARRAGVPVRLRRWLDAAALLVLLQVGLGAASVLTVLAVVPVSLHSLGAALLVVTLAWVATRARVAAVVQAQPAAAAAR